jgi:hypothetical protein
MVERIAGGGAKAGGFAGEKDRGIGFAEYK